MNSTKQFPQLAKSIRHIVDGTDPVANRIRDRSSPITQDLIDDVMGLLQIGYAGRRPRTLTDTQGRSRPTDMDIASFLVQLLEKQTILELPGYANALPQVDSTNERHLSERRYGTLLALSSHRQHLSFGITINDMSIIRRSTDEVDSIGAPRTFLIVSHTGEWHKGWKGLSWVFRKNETDFRDRYDLLSDTTHTGYQYFVHPNRRQSIFSRAHLLLKLLWQRLDDEMHHFHNPKTMSGNEKDFVSHQRSGQHAIVPTFTMELKGLPCFGQYPRKSADTSTDEGREYLRYIIRSRTQVQFLVRLNEYAFYLYGRRKDYIAHWIKDGFWRHVIPRDINKRQVRLHLSNQVSLTYTCSTVSKKVI